MTPSLSQSQKDALVEALEERRKYLGTFDEGDFGSVSFGFTECKNVIESFQTSRPSSGFKEADTEEMPTKLANSTYRGIPLSEMSRAELASAVVEMSNAYVRELKNPNNSGTSETLEAVLQRFENSSILIKKTDGLWYAISQIGDYVEVGGFDTAISAALALEKKLLSVK